MALPLLYYQNNIMSTLVLLEELGKTSCRNFVFSSSATVYGTSPSPITEGSNVGEGITNPYGKRNCLTATLFNAEGGMYVCRCPSGYTGRE